MKLKKIALIVVTMLTIMSILSVFSKSYAATAPNPMWLKIIMLRSGNGYGYKALEKNIWKIVQTNSSGTTQDYSKTIYCLKGGPGFGSSTFGSGDPKHRPYTEYFDMKTATSTSIPSPYSDALPSFTSETYKSLLWLLDNIYVNPKVDSEKAAAKEYRDILTAKAGVGDYITDDDIDAVQQLAIWHFTNKDTYTEYYIPDNGTFEFWVNAVAGSDANYGPLSDNKNDGEERAEECQALYDYLVTTATAMGKAGYTPTTSTKPYEIDRTLTKTKKVDGNNVIIGPFKIKKLTDDTTESIKGIFKNGDIEITPTLQDASGNKFSTLEDTVKDGKGNEKEFYIVLPKTTNIEKITFEISGSYFNTTATYWAVNENQQQEDQPVVEVNKVKKTYEDSEEIIFPPEDDHFDLALRKFITQLNDDEDGLKDKTTGKYLREPVVDVGPLKNGGENATYTHPKTPVEVENGDIVIYTLRIYNEGNQEGYAEQIKDNLPEGLEFLPTHAINQEYRWNMYKEDGKTITTNLSEAKTVRTDYLSKAQQDATGRDNLLKAFDANTMTELPYKDVKIAFKVIEPDSSDRILVNTAEISADSEDDRDSIPDNDKEDEDDIDKEYVKLKEKYFDLALRKFITQLNDDEDGLKDKTTGKYLREPVVDVGPLKNGGKDATYTHPKTPVEVENGDIVIYTLRIYNEGNQEGYAEQIKDNLPEGLEFLPTHQTNIDYRWNMYKEDGKTITTNLSEAKTVRTDYLSKAQQDATGRDNLLKAFDANTMTELPYKDVKIAFKVIEPDSSERILVNTAEISADSDDDRDSIPNNDKEDEDDIDKEYVKLKEKYFDLALRKFITQLNDDEDGLKDKTTGKYIREPQVDVGPLKNGGENATYTHPKTPVEVENGDIVIYTLRIYNEGNQEGYAEEIKDNLPEGLEFLPTHQTNIDYRWNMYKADGTIATNLSEATTVRTDYLSKAQQDATGRDNLLKAFDANTMTEPPHKDVKIAFKVIEPDSSDRILVNIAEISNDSDDDRDSIPNNDKEDEDDIDKEYVKLKEKFFDLALRKFITAVNDTELKNTTTGKYIREPQVDVSPLIKGEDTAIYNHPKKPVSVAVGDKVTYTIRVYNEGQLDGYVKSITDHLPQYLEFDVNDPLNAQYGWKVSNNGRTVTTDITSPNTEYSASRDTIYENRREGTDKVLLKKFENTMTEPDYIDVKIRCTVKGTNLAQKLTNIAEISDFVDANGKEKDKDSQKGNVTLPNDTVLPNYKDEEIDEGKEYIPGQEDDDDFEKVIIEKFDLALRKFITAVNDKKITNRVPVFSMDADKKYQYTHPKTPVEVATGDIVTYTLRIYNEGNKDGYAEEVKDNIPQGLEYLPNHPTNKEYEWDIYKEDGKTKATSIAEAKTVRTDYLSKAKDGVNGRKNLIKAFDTNKMTQPDYKEVKIAFKVLEPNTSDRVIINKAEISKDSDDDTDSEPDNDKDNEDDIDIEKVKVKYFDLSLKKIISKVTKKIDGKTTVTQTKHKFDVEPEPVVKLELKEHDIKNAVIKFTYKIRVKNEGEIEGYVKEIRDYIPKGLKFVKKDNPKWKLSDDGKTVTTDQLKDKLLKPGESAIVEITFQWINGQNNLGLKKNIAEISKDYNDHDDTDDIDSTPDNKKDGEDDIDDASVVLSVTTGTTGGTIILIGTVVLAVLGTGLGLIKRFVI